MGKLAEAYVDVGANLRPMQAGLGRAKSMLTSFASKAAMVSIGAVGGGAGIGAGLLAAAKKSADLGESISKVHAHGDGNEPGTLRSCALQAIGSSAGFGSHAASHR